MRPDRTAPPPATQPALKDSTLDTLSRLELYLSNPDTRDAMQNGTAGITPQQGQALRRNIHDLTTDSVNSRLGPLLGAAQANNKELQTATKEWIRSLRTSPTLRMS